MASLGKCATRDYLTWETKCLLSELKEYHEIEVIWTKGHNKNTGNEVADMLAKEGALMARDMSYAAPFMTTCQGQVKNGIRKMTKKMGAIRPACGLEIVCTKGWSKQTSLTAEYKGAQYADSNSDRTRPFQEAHEALE